MKFFSKEETKVVVLIFAVIAVISFFNFRAAIKRGRDNARGNDLSDIAKVLEDYHTKFSKYPTSLEDLRSFNRNVPEDPGTPFGYSYLYITDGKYFQLYASLETGADNSLFMPNVASRGLICGKFVCNFGKASGNTPLDKTLEEYENSINAQTKKTK